MGKRSEFERKPRDYYKSPYEVVAPLIPHLEFKSFVEPCAGDGSLVRHLESFGLNCSYACDIEPQAPKIDTVDVLKECPSFDNHEQIITNSPWSRKIYHPMINIFRLSRPTWLLIDSDWMFTKQSSGWNQPTNYMKYCHKIVTVGRVSWEQNGVTGKDNAVWLYFKDTPGKAEFFGKQI